MDVYLYESSHTPYNDNSIGRCIMFLLLLYIPKGIFIKINWMFCFPGCGVVYYIYTNRHLPTY